MIKPLSLILCMALGACAHTAPAPSASLEMESAQLVSTHLAEAGPVRLRVVTYNVHFAADVPRLAAALRASEPLRTADVMLLQEVRSYPAEGQSRTERLARELGLNFVYAPARHTRDGGTHGLALLSRYPIIGHEVLELPPYKVGGEVERRIALTVTLNVGGRALRVINVHLDTRLDLKDRLAQLRPVLEGAAEGDLILGGDFNTAPFRWLRGRLPIARTRQAEGLDAAMLRAGCDNPLAKARSTMTSGILPMRLDAIYLRGMVAAGGAVERQVRTSDHLPLWVDVLL